VIVGGEVGELVGKLCSGQHIKEIAGDEIIPIDEMIIRYTEHVVRLCDGNKTRAAKALGIHRRSLYRRLERKAA
jgi:ActR/RegA family two-component response regulator